MAKKQSEAIKTASRLDEYCQGKFREMLLEMNHFREIYEVYAKLTAMGFETPESKLEVLDPLFKKFYRKS